MAGGVIRSIITEHSPRIGVEPKALGFTRGLFQDIRLPGEEVRAAKPGYRSRSRRLRNLAR